MELLFERKWLSRKLMPNNRYKPIGLWSHHDFLINKYYWKKYGVENSKKIRIKNLKDIHDVLDSHNISHWLQGKTLLGIFKYGKLLNDHDDDIGIFMEDKDLMLIKVSNDLLKKGFTLIRSNDSIISFQRNYRYVDICLFKKRANKIGYANKWFDVSHFSEFKSLYWKNIKFQIPAKSNQLLNSEYSKNKFILILLYVRHLIGSQNKLKKIKLRIARRLPLLFRLPFPNLLLSKFLAPLLGIKIYTISEDDFLNLSIEDESSFNWKWRKRHLDLVTNNKSHLMLGELVEYHSNPQTKQKIEELVVDTDTSKPFFPPTNYDMDFWWGGNNYFWYCIKYQYRKNVVAYSEVNEFINRRSKPYLFSNEYYNSLEAMCDYEIADFLKNNPIEIRNKSIISGKHRVFAMLGRLSSGKKYIPVTVIDWD